MNRDDIRMAHASHQPPFLDYILIRADPADVAVSQEFERNLAIEGWIPGAVDVAESASADTLEKA